MTDIVNVLFIGFIGALMFIGGLILVESITIFLGVLWDGFNTKAIPRIESYGCSVKIHPMAYKFLKSHWLGIRYRIILLLVGREMVVINAKIKDGALIINPFGGMIVNTSIEHTSVKIPLDVTDEFCALTKED